MGAVRESTVAKGTVSALNKAGSSVKSATTRVMENETVRPGRRPAPVHCLAHCPGLSAGPQVPKHVARPVAQVHSATTAVGSGFRKLGQSISSLARTGRRNSSGGNDLEPHAEDEPQASSRGARAQR